MDIMDIRENLSQELNELWRDRKKDSVLLSQSYWRLGHYYKNNTLLSWQERISQCASYLEFKINEENTKKLHKAYFCESRLCSMCNWRRSKKIFHQVAKIINEIDKLKEYDYLFLTFTSKNVTSNKLNDEITNLLNSFMRMFHKQKGDKRIKAISKGYFRTLEVTYNKKDNTYNPHLHCIIVVDKSYFKSNNYIDQKKKEWSEIWKKYLKVDYLPIVWVERIKDKNDTRTKKKGIKEVSKYSVKGNDVVLKNKEGELLKKLTDNNVFNLHFALKGRRLIGMGGVFKELHKKLNLEDMNKDNINLINLDNTEEGILNYIIVKCKWSIGLSNYVILD